MLKTILAISLGKLIQTLSRFFKIGGGSAAPGHFALKLDPNLIEKLTRSIPQSIVITGTNGKTTTTKLISNFASKEKITVLTQGTGSNMERGLVSKLIEKSSLFGTIKGIDLAVWEADEASFNKVIFKIKPKVIVLLNAARDQLDRYGEFDTLVTEWRESLKKADWNPLVIVNADDGSTYSLTQLPSLNSQTFGADKKIVKWEKENKGKIRKDFEASNIKNNGLGGFEFTLKADRKAFKITFPVAGLYHIYDILAAFAVGYNLNLSTNSMINTLENYVPVFGRVEKLSLQPPTSTHEIETYILLIKNPSGATSVFETIAGELKEEDKLLLALNDNLADGTDVSWIWDVDFERLAHPGGVIVSGTRAQDLALRLKYAGFKESQIIIENDLSKALTEATKDLKSSPRTAGKLFILPTYTALLELQKTLAKRGIKKHYWKEQ